MSSECPQSVFRVSSECVQSVFNIEVISSSSASSVSIFGIFEYIERYIDYITGAYIGLSTQISSTHLYLECIPAKLPIYCLIASRTRYMYVFISLFRDVY